MGVGVVHVWVWVHVWMWCMCKYVGGYACVGTYMGACVSACIGMGAYVC